MNKVDRSVQIDKSHNRGQSNLLGPSLFILFFFFFFLSFSFFPPSGGIAWMLDSLVIIWQGLRILKILTTGPTLSLVNYYRDILHFCMPLCDFAWRRDVSVHVLDIVGCFLGDLPEKSVKEIPSCTSTIIV